MSRAVSLKVSLERNEILYLVCSAMRFRFRAGLAVSSNVISPANP